MNSSAATRRKKQQLNKLKKSINELMLLGQITEDDAEKTLQDGIQQMESGVPAAKIIAASSSSTNGTEKSYTDSSMKLPRKLAAARNQKQPGPELTLTLDRLGGALLSHNEIRDLIHFSLLGSSVTKPKWARFRPWKSTSQTILTRVNVPNHYLVNERCNLAYVNEFFEKQWIKMSSEVSDRSNFWKALVNVPVSVQEQIRERVLKLEAEGANGNLGKKDELRLEMLVKSVEMANHCYPFPDDTIKATRQTYAKVTSESPMFALDCEMCLTTAQQHELTRISVIREDGSVVLDTLVKPINEITNYLTKFSGITEEILKDVTVTLEDVQKALSACLPPDAILVGHSLEFDLRALRMAHPYCIDVGLVYNLTGSAKMRSSLRSLVSVFLDEDIQISGGHCSVEDAWAAMRLVQMKIEKGLMFGSCVYGFDYDGYLKSQEKISLKKRHMQNEELEAANGVKKEEPHSEGKVRCRTPRLCECGERIGVDCIVEDCQCQKAPPMECVRCIGKKEKIHVEDGVDWSSSLQKDLSTKTRPLCYYMVDTKKTVLCGFGEVEDMEMTPNRIFKVRVPGTNDQNEFVDEVSSELLEYGLAMMELDYLDREAQLRQAKSDELEDGEEPPDLLEEVVKELDENLEKIIRSAARYSLIVVVISSENLSIVYLRVKP